jgi:hypothetical protein
MQPAPAPAQLSHVARLGQIVTRTAAHTPWRHHCLAQALALAAMLRVRTLPFTLCLGARSCHPGLEAHAWICCGSLTINGPPASASVARLATIAYPGRSLR